MSRLQNMPLAGAVVIVIILALFILAVLLLVHCCTRYRRLARHSSGDDSDNARGFRAAVLDAYEDAYRKFGREVNTPAIIEEVIANRLSGLMFCERFLNNAVSLFVTLGLFGTFLGLSLSVSSLTELIGTGNSREWLSVLDNVGSGLLSALGGMGVAFYTSLTGAFCSILLTLLRTVFSPQAEREKLETRLELWLDEEVAPNLETESIRDNYDMARQVVKAMNGLVRDMGAALANAATAYADTTKRAAAALNQSAQQSIQTAAAYDAAIGKFNAGVQDFQEVDYNLRGSVERLDLAVRDLTSDLRKLDRRAEAARQ